MLTLSRVVVFFYPGAHKRSSNGRDACPSERKHHAVLTFSRIWLQFVVELYLWILN